MIKNSCLHRWRNSQGFVNPAKVIMHEVKSDGVFVILAAGRTTLCLGLFSVSRTGNRIIRR
jgi:hypothetical protein